MLGVKHMAVAEKLLDELHRMGKRYEALQCSRDDYLQALGRFSDLILDGKLPEDLSHRALRSRALKRRCRPIIETGRRMKNQRMDEPGLFTSLPLVPPT